MEVLKKYSALNCVSFSLFEGTTENIFHIFRTLKNSLNGSSFIWSKQTSHKSGFFKATSVRRKTPPKRKCYLSRNSQIRKLILKPFLSKKEEMKICFSSFPNLALKIFRKNNLWLPSYIPQRSALVRGLHFKFPFCLETILTHPSQNLSGNLKFLLKIPYLVPMWLILAKNY